MLRKHTIYLIKTLLLVLACLPGFSQVQGDPQASYKIKHLQSFANYTTWPNLQKSTVFRLGVIGSEDTFLKIKRYYSGKKIKDKKVDVIFFPEVDSDFACDMLFIAKEAQDVEKVLSLTSGKPILTVSGTNQVSGFLVSFVVFDNTISYELNPKAYNDASLEVDYYFLKTSRIVK